MMVCMILPNSLEPDILSQPAYAAFGTIMHAFARFEFAIAVTLAHVSEIQLDKLLVITQPMSYSAKRDILYSYIEFYKIEAGIKQEIKGYLDALDKYVTLRNHIAHSLWAPGVRTNSYRPMTIRTRGGKALVKGMIDDGSEIDYTDSDIIDIANKLNMLHNSYITYADAKGMLLPVTAQQTSPPE
jgi:hypothetical protein